MKMLVEQRGFTFTGFVFGAALLVSVAIFSMKLIPAYMENGKPAGDADHHFLYPRRLQSLNEAGDLDVVGLVTILFQAPRQLFSFMSTDVPFHVSVPELVRGFTPFGLYQAACSSRYQSEHRCRTWTCRCNTAIPTCSNA